MLLNGLSFSSLVAEFDLWLRVNIGCILNFETEYGEAANVLYAIDDLNASINLRIDLQKDLEIGDFIFNKPDSGAKNNIMG